MEVSPSTTHPNPQPDLHYRKIELQSPLDLEFLQSNLSASARQKLDLHFPPSALSRKPPPATHISLDGRGGDASNGRAADVRQAQEEEVEEEEDPLRARVRSLVDAFLARTWSEACENVTINGLDAAPTLHLGQHSKTQPQRASDKGEEREGVDFIYSAYDNRLQQRVASLYGEVEALTAQVSRLRREAPGKGAEMYKEALGGAMEGDEKKANELRGNENESGNRIQLDELRKGWLQDAQTLYEHGVGELARLGGVTRKGEGESLTETVGKVQRARTVAMELE